MSRSISYTEVSTALTCPAQWDFRYGGHLAGDALRSRVTAPILREGRAWGAAVAAWHQHADQMFARWDAQRALIETVAADAKEMSEAGVPLDTEAQLAMEERLMAMLEHYSSIAPPLLNLTRLEGEIDVPLWSRSSHRSSARYRFLCRLDGLTVDHDGSKWLVEFKLRRDLTPVHLLQIMPQHRWYAWAYQRETGDRIVGVLIDERVNAVPEAPRILANGKVSSDKRQVTTPELYVAACNERGQLPEQEVVVNLEARRWQQVSPIQFRQGELEEAGAELVSAAKLIRDLDSGELAPIRNARRANCNWCQFRHICPNPRDRLLVDVDFERIPPKRQRLEVAA